MGGGDSGDNTELETLGSGADSVAIRARKKSLLTSSGLL